MLFSIWLYVVVIGVSDWNEVVVVNGLGFCVWNLRCWGLSSQNGRKGSVYATNCCRQRSLLRCMPSAWWSLLWLWDLMDGWYIVRRKCVTEILSIVLLFLQSLLFADQYGSTIGVGPNS